MALNKLIFFPPHPTNNKKNKRKKPGHFPCLKKSRDAGANSSCTFLQEVGVGRASQGRMPANKQTKASIYFWD